jgi:FkbM family methyltransferase
MKRIVFFDKLLRLLKTLIFKSTTYQIGKYTIQIPTTATLPIYQKTFPLYDRFLPVLANNLDSKGIIIDVGANVGDTLVGMIQQCENTFICIEPSNLFFKYLKKNTQRLNAKDAERVELVQKLVGTGDFSGELHESGSTAHIVYSQEMIPGEVTHIRLDDVVQNHDNIILIKSDVDGFDFDVIKSADKILLESEPVLFFENDIEYDFQREEFDKLYDFLQSRGYHHIYIFDNFGNIIIEKSDYHTLKNINEYLYSMIKYNKTRTFYYTDILIATDKRLLTVKKAVENYKEYWIKNPCKK